jgi:hypothetical protein
MRSRNEYESTTGLVCRVDSIHHGPFAVSTQPRFQSIPLLHGLNMRLLTLLLAIFVSANVLSADEKNADKPKPPAGLSTAELEILGRLLDPDWKGDKPEWAVMADSILKNKPMGNGLGWFKPAAKTYGWNWLAKTFPKETVDNIIKPGELDVFSKAEFKRLDRNNDGGISRHDFDWSGGNRMMGSDMADMVFEKLDLDYNGRISKKELDEWFAKTGEGFDFLTMMDLRKGLNLRPPNMFGGRGGGRRDQRMMMFRRLLNGELGSLTDGPKLGDKAPEVNLPLLARNAKKTEFKLTDTFIKLADYRGKKPVVLIFGSFT